MLTVIADYALPALRAMDPESVQCVVTSIPYWSLRDYGIAPVVWDEFVECEHEWQTTIRVGGGAQPGDKERWNHTGTGNSGHQKAESQFCCICNAWLGSWGLEPTPELYVQHTVQVFREVRRVLRKDGTLWLNIGDCYAGGGRGADVGGSLEGGRQGQVESRKAQKSLRSTRHNKRESNRAAASQSFRRVRKPQGDVRHKEAPGVKPKDLIGLPWLIAFALRNDGWYLRSDIVWRKPNAMPESCTDRPTRAHEYIFLLTRSSRYYYDQQAIAEPSSPATHARLSQKTLMTQNGGPKQEAYDEGQPGKKHHDRRPHEIMKATAAKHGINPKTAAHGSGIRSNESFQAAISAEIPMTRNKRTVWTVPTAPYSDAHFATFPPDLITPCVLAGTRAGDVVMDICGGSGTTAEVAIGLGRRAVIIEPKAEYREMIEKRSRVTIGLPLS